MSPRIGALFAGYGGLDEGVRQVYGGDVAWYSEIDKGVLKILAYRYPGIPNVGSVTEADWSQVEPVDILTGGSPCQDLSHAGKRQGMTEGTRSNLWVAMREAIAQLRPATVVWENVRGAFSAAADSEVEPCAGCVGDGSGVHLRALGRVLGDLSELGYDARWHGLRAADVGAPHGRFRVFVVATDTQHREGRVGHDADLLGGRADDAEQARLGDCGTLTLLSTPQSRDHKGVPGSDFNLASLPRDVSLLPTPAVNDMGAAYTPETWDEWCAKQQAKHGNGNGHGKSLAIEAQRLLPTPNAGDAKQGYVTEEEYEARATAKKATNPKLGELHQDLAYVAQTAAHRWGDYAHAIARWEGIAGRPAPEPTQTSTKGNPQLSAKFVEWMMGLPAGWVTDTPGITRNEALKALGNGVVPQQCAEALRVMASWSAVAA